MNAKSTIIIISLLLALFLAPVAASYVPQAGDHFSYIEVTNLGNGFGDYSGYSEHATYNGTETINTINTDGTVSAHYSYSYLWSNNSGSIETGNPSGDFTFSPVTFLYVNGTDDQMGYVNPSVWFVMDNSIPTGGTFSLLNTVMTVISTNYSYYLPSQGRNVNVIFAQGQSSYQRNDIYGQFSATYTWKAYFDPATGYIVGYSYNEQDNNNAGTGFTYTEELYVNSTSYPLTTAASGTPTQEPPTPFISSTSSTTSSRTAYFGVIAIVAIAFIVLVLIGIISYALSTRNRKLPRHSYQQPYQQQPPPPNPHPREH